MSTAFGRSESCAALWLLYGDQANPSLSKREIGRLEALLNNEDEQNLIDWKEEVLE